MRQRLIGAVLFSFLLSLLFTNSGFAGNASISLFDISAPGTVTSGKGGSTYDNYDFNQQSTGVGQSPYDLNLFSSNYGQQGQNQIQRPFCSTGQRPGLYILVGDQMWYISAIIMMDPYGWRVIYNANQGNIQNPNQLNPGSTINIPNIADVPIQSLINGQMNNQGTYTQNQNTIIPSGSTSIIPSDLDQYLTQGFNWSQPIGNQNYTQNTYTQNNNQQQQQTNNGRFNASMPIRTGTVTSNFGRRTLRGRPDNHGGLDVGANKGTPIYSCGDGVVEWVGWNGGYGKLVKVRHSDGTVSYYGHCNSYTVSKGQRVRAGQQIATVNSTGNSTGNHLHFEVRRNGSAVDPRRYFNFPSKGARL